MVRNKIWVLSIIITISLLSLLGAFSQVFRTIDKTEVILQQQIQAFMQRQETLLQALAINLRHELSVPNHMALSKILAAYEDLIYNLSRDKLIVPVSIEIITLDAPSKIFTSQYSDANHTSNLASHYYQDLLNNHNKLTISKIYNDENMPGYGFVDYGLLINDGGLQDLAVLNVRMAVAKFIEYLQYDLDLSKYELYFDAQDITQPRLKFSFYKQIKIIGFLFIEYWYYIASLMIIIGFVVYVYKKLKYFELDFIENKCNLIDAQQKLGVYEQLWYLQKKYGVLAASNISIVSQVKWSDILSEVLLLNKLLAKARQIKLIHNVDNVTDNNLYIDVLPLVKVLSGLLQAVLYNLASDSKVSIEFMQHDEIQYEFTIRDDGFYTSLDEYRVEANLYAITCCSWREINDVLKANSATVVHKHKAYVGNEICVFWPIQKSAKVIDFKLQSTLQTID